MLNIEKGIPNMYALIGEINDVYQDRPGGPFKDHWSEVIIALFTTEQLANEYIKKSRVPAPYYTKMNVTKYFEDESLLSNCQVARVEKYKEPQYEINPKL